MKERNERTKAAKTKNLIQETRKRIAFELLSKKLNEYTTIKDNNGCLYYVVDGVLFQKWNLLQLKHKGLTIAKNYGLFKL